MVKIKALIYFITLLVPLVAIAQNQSYITGTITNIENSEPLPFATITLKNYPIGTTSNDNGEFDFYIPKSQRHDTLSVSFMGFDQYFIPLKQIKNPVEIVLTPTSNILDEVIVSRLSPLDYIKKAVDNLEQNYPKEPYQTIAYYRERFIENGNIINKYEGVFKTYYPPAKNTIKNQHQLLLYRPEPNPQQFQFMREWIEKKAEKEKKKAIKKGEPFDEEDYDGDIDMSFGGPQTILNLDIKEGNDNFLDKKHFKKYDYSFGEETSLNGESMITINFQAKRKIDHLRDQGKIIMSKESYAIARIEQTGTFSVPFLVRPILFAIGLKIKNPQFTRTVTYKKIDGLWYPSLFRWDAGVHLTKKHMFASNEHSDLSIGQVFLINNIESNGTAIPKEKRFDPSEDMENQIHNNDGISWQFINSIKD